MLLLQFYACPSSNNANELPHSSIHRIRVCRELAVWTSPVNQIVIPMGTGIFNFRARFSPLRAHFSEFSVTPSFSTPQNLPGRVPFLGGRVAQKQNPNAPSYISANFGLKIKSYIKNDFISGYLYVFWFVCRFHFVRKSRTFLFTAL